MKVICLSIPCFMFLVFDSKSIKLAINIEEYVATTMLTTKKK